MNTIQIIAIVIIISVFSYMIYRHYNNYILYKKNALIIDKMTSSVNNRVDAEDIINPKLGNTYTVSFWMYIDTIYTHSDYWRHVFHRGTDVEDKILNYQYWNNVTTDIPEQNFGLWFHPNINTIRFAITNNKNDIEHLDIEDIPSKTLVHFVIVVKNQIVSIWRDGKLFSTKGLVNQPLMSIKALYFHYQYTYSGKLLKFMYVPRELNTVDIHYLYKHKPIV